MEMDIELAEEVGQGLMIAGSVPASVPPLRTLTPSCHFVLSLYFGQVTRPGVPLAVSVETM
jgi:hypothetical protein